MRWIFAITSFAILLFANPMFILAQDTPDIQGGIAPLTSYHGGDIDKVSLQNGNLFVSIPLFDLPQRGDALKLSFSLINNNKLWTFGTCQTTAGSPVCPSFSTCPNLGITCTTFWNPIGVLSGILLNDDQLYKFIATTQDSGHSYATSVLGPDGTKHAMGTIAEDQTVSSNPTITAISLDGSGIRYHGTLDGLGTLTLRNGVSTTFGTQGIWTRQDSNGNQIIFSGSWQDTLGRVVSNTSTSDFTNCTGPLPIASASVLTVPTLNGGSRQFKLCSVTVPLQTNFGVPGRAEYTGAESAVQSVVLPDGSAWTFEYNSRASTDGANINYGELTKMTYPTGGTVTYTWESQRYFSSAVGTTRVLQSRTVDASDGTGAHTWTYSWNLGTSPFSVTVSDPSVDGVTTSVTSTLARVAGLTGPFYETMRQVFQNGILIQTVSIDYTPDAAPASAFPIRITTSWPSGKISKEEIDYDVNSFVYGGAIARTNSVFAPTISARYGVRTAKREYDFYTQGITPNLLHQSILSYLWQSQPSYKNSNFLDLITSEVIQDGSGTRVAETDYTFDESQYLTGTTISTQHLSLPPSALRGNQTTIARWLNTTGAVLTSHQNWFDTGELSQISDPLGHKIAHSYDSTYIGAYLTQTCSSATGNGVIQHCVNASYDFSSGLRTSSTDQNGQTTTYNYDPLTLRVKSVTLPADPGNGGSHAQISFAYSAPKTFPFTVTRTKSVTPASSDSVTNTYDGLARLLNSQHATPSGTATFDTVYDAQGRVRSVSNPYYTTTDSTYGVTQNKYDALNRPIIVTKQDGSIATNDFSSGNCNTMQDEAGNQRRICRDGLGRINEVDEPGGPDPGRQAVATITISGAFNSTSASISPMHPAAPGTSMSSVTMADGSSHTFYFDTNYHLCHLFWNSTSGWSNQDLTEQTESSPALTGSSVSAVVLGSVVHVFNQSSNQHIIDTEWTGSVWQNLDLTTLTGATALAGTKMSALVGGPNSPQLYYQGTNQHLFIVYWLSSPVNAWGNGDLNLTTGQTALMATNSSISSGAYGSGLYPFYISTNQHIITNYWSGTAWSTADLTAITGAALAASGSSLTTLVASSGATPMMTFYEGTNGHIYSIYWFTGNNTWQTSDFSTPNVAATSSGLANNPAGPHAFYLGSTQHLMDANWNGSAWVNSDLTSLSGGAATAATGSSLSAHGTSGGNTSHVFFTGADQHIYDTYYSPSAPIGWHLVDLFGLASNYVIDSGTVSLTIPNGTSNFTATVCYGTSTNPACAGKPINASLSDITNALASALNATGSPVTAVVANSTTLNLTWRTSGVITATVASMTSASDYASIFPSGSFTSTPASFSGGLAPSSQSLNNPFITQYQYDALGNLLRVDQKGSAPSDSSQWRSRIFTYDSLSRLLTATNPETNTISYDYDNDGNLLHKIILGPNQTGKIISYCYDELHRVTGKAYSLQTCQGTLLPVGTAVVSYLYDQGANANGQLTSMIDQAGSGSYTFDPLGRILSEQRVIAGITKNISYEYNLNGSLKVLHYPSGAALTYSPWQSGPIGTDMQAEAKDILNNINYVTSGQYLAGGQLSSFIYGKSSAFSGITNIYTNNSRLQPITMSAASPSQAIFSVTYDFHFSHGDNGNLFSIVNGLDATRNQAFTYDGLNRLTSAQNAGTDCSKTTLNAKSLYWAYNYTYDSWANLTGKTFTKCSGSNLQLIPLSTNQLGGYSYDFAGNLLSDPTQNTSLAYDPENRISTASTQSGSFSYMYDGDGNRVQKSSSSSGILYWYGIPGVLAESDTQGNIISEYIFFNNQRVARRDLPAGSVEYYFSDHLKTASVITDALGNIKANSDYGPWGEEMQLSQGDSNRYKFTGKERDSESQYDYFAARYYSNILGRFLTPDWSANPVPIPYADLSDPQSLNLYAYVRNLPTTRFDIDGHKGDSGDMSALAGNENKQPSGWDKFRKWWHETICCKSAKETTEEHRQWLRNRARSEAAKKEIDKLSDDIINGMWQYWNDPQTQAQQNQQFIAQGIIPPSQIPQYPAMDKPDVTNGKLQSIVDELYQPTDKVPGGTAGAVRYERITGNLLSPKGHAPEAGELVKRISNFLRSNPGISTHDQNVAKELINDLTRALSGN